jgi:hypothetical protein
LHAVQHSARSDPTDEAFAMDHVMAQYVPPPPSVVQAQVTITLPGDIRDFSDREQSSLVQIIARFARLRPDQIKVVRVVAGSIHVTLELPESSARWLVTLYERQAPLIDLLDIQAVRDLRVLPAPDDATRTPRQISVANAKPALSTLEGAHRHKDAGERHGYPLRPGIVAALRSVLEKYRLTAWLPGWTRRRSLFLASALVAVLLVVALITTLRESALPDGTLVGVVAELQGTLELRSVGWNAFAPVAVGTLLRAGDRLRLETGAQARVVCADGTPVELQAGIASTPCQSRNQRLFDIDQVPWANAVLSAGAADIPQVITPRATALLTTTPTIRWTAVDGADTYTVLLYREGQPVWRETVRATTTLPYPADQPPLESGSIYRFGVTADDGPEEIAQGSGVQVLDAQQAQAVRAAARPIEQLDVDDATERLLLANLYASRGLYAEALALLELPADPPTQPALLQLLGDVYLAAGLPRLAIAPYTQALAAAEQADNRLGQARANRMLGMGYSRLGGEQNRERAVSHYRQALQFYEEVGDADAQEELRQLLADLA